MTLPSQDAHNTGIRTDDHGASSPQASGDEEQHGELDEQQDGEQHEEQDEQQDGEQDEGQESTLGTKAHSFHRIVPC